MGFRQAAPQVDQGRCVMAGLLDFLTDDERAAQQRALQAYTGQVGQQQARQEVWDALGQTLPAQLIKSIYQAARLPGDVYQGKIDPRSDEAISRAADFAGAAITGSMPFAVRGALGSGGGKMVQPEGFTVYHGSPHNFDRFEMSKIGTGEGAQAYGRGLYFAENENVARSYRDALSQSSPEVAYKGNPLPVYTGRPMDASGLKPEDYYASVFGSKEDPASAMKAHIQYLESQKRMIPLRDELPPSVKERAIKGIDEQIADIQAVDPTKIEKLKKGHMYEARIRAEKENFLDWDKPFDQQSEAVKDMLRRLPKETLDNLKGSLPAALSGADQYAASKVATGERIMKELIDAEARARNLPTLYETPKGKVVLDAAEGARETLNKLGIPGVRYLDRGSRGQGDGDRNYVVFDDNLIEILRKYGLVGLLGGGAVAAGANAPKPIKREDIERGLL